AIHLLWLPKQWSELNPMDQLWKELKQDIVANRQYASIDEAVAQATAWLCRLTPRQVFEKAGLHSKSYWLNQKNWRSHK
ncbi:MAG TPA: integrase, partial [Clostridia bacterium]|nr:integrase [Clostridia bacterium]